MYEILNSFGDGTSWEISDNIRKFSGVARTLSEIPFMTKRKSHAFDSNKGQQKILLTLAEYVHWSEGN